MDITKQICTYAKILEDETSELVGYALHIISFVSDCGYIAAGAEVSKVENDGGAYEIEVHINQDDSILHFPYTTPLIHVVNLKVLELDKYPKRKMEIVAVVDGKKKEPKPLDQPSPNVIRRPIKK